MDAKVRVTGGWLKVGEGCLVPNTAVIILWGDTKEICFEIYTWGCQVGSSLICKKRKGTPNTQENGESTLGGMDVPTRNISKLPS